jgi:acyl-CoA reductase-like NAD-dependent aldehyde dehydrogenase
VEWISEFAQWGPGILILVGVYLFGIRILPVVEKLLHRQADAISEQTEAIRELTNLFKNHAENQKAETREILLTVRFIAEHIRSLEKEELNAKDSKHREK